MNTRFDLIVIKLFTIIGLFTSLICMSLFIERGDYLLGLIFASTLMGFVLLRLWVRERELQ